MSHILKIILFCVGSFQICCALYIEMSTSLWEGDLRPSKSSSPEAEYFVKIIHELKNDYNFILSSGIVVCTCSAILIIREDKKI